MKNLLFILLLLPFAAFSQKTDTTFFKGATKIIIKNNLNATDNYKLLIGKLMDDDFRIDKKDDEYHYLKTELKKIPNSTFSFLLNAKVKDNEIQFTGEYNTGVSVMLLGANTNQGNEQIVYKNWAENKIPFKSMEKAARLFSMQLIYSN